MSQELLPVGQDIKAPVAAVSGDLLKMNIVQSRILVAQKLLRSQDKIIKQLREMFDNDLIRKFYSSSDKVIYSVPRKSGNQTHYITGLTINAIKDLANIYSHLDYGVEVNRIVGRDYALCTAFCLDLQNNTCEKREFKVIFPDKIKGLKNFSDESYKIIYSEGTRRMRACIERILPVWLRETFMEKVVNLQNETFAKKPKEALESALDDYLPMFKKYSNKITKKDLQVLLKVGGVKDKTPQAAQFLHQTLGSLNMGETTLYQLFPLLKKEESESKPLEKTKKEIDSKEPKYDDKNVQMGLL